MHLFFSSHSFAACALLLVLQCCSLWLTVHAALSVPNGYESLIRDIRERVVVSERDVKARKETGPQSCTSAEGPYCLRSSDSPNFLGDTVLSRRLFGAEAAEDALKTLNQYLQWHSSGLFRRFRERHASSSILRDGTAESELPTTDAAERSSAIVRESSKDASSTSKSSTGSGAKLGRIIANNVALEAGGGADEIADALGKALESLLSGTDLGEDVEIQFAGGGELSSLFGKHKDKDKGSKDEKSSSIGSSKSNTTAKNNTASERESGAVEKSKYVERKASNSETGSGGQKTGSSGGQTTGSSGGQTTGSSGGQTAREGSQSAASTTSGQSTGSSGQTPSGGGGQQQAAGGSSGGGASASRKVVDEDAELDALDEDSPTTEAPSSTTSTTTTASTTKTTTTSTTTTTKVNEEEQQRDRFKEIKRMEGRGEHFRLYESPYYTENEKTWRGNQVKKYGSFIHARNADLQEGAASKYSGTGVRVTHNDDTGPNPALAFLPEDFVVTLSERLKQGGLQRTSSTSKTSGSLSEIHTGAEKYSSVFTQFAARHFPGNFMGAEISDKDMYMKRLQLGTNSLYDRQQYTEQTMPIFTDIFPKEGGRLRTLVQTGELCARSAEHIHAEIVARRKEAPEHILYSRWVWPQHRPVGEILEEAGLKHAKTERSGHKKIDQDDREQIFIIESRFSRLDDFPPAVEGTPFCYEDCAAKHLVGLAEGESVSENADLPRVEAVVEHVAAETVAASPPSEAAADSEKTVDQDLTAASSPTRASRESHLRPFTPDKHLLSAQRRFFGAQKHYIVYPRRRRVARTRHRVYFPGASGVWGDYGLSRLAYSNEEVNYVALASDSYAQWARKLHEILWDNSVLELQHRGYIHGLKFTERMSRFITDGTFALWPMANGASYEHVNPMKELRRGQAAARAKTALKTREEAYEAFRKEVVAVATEKALTLLPNATDCKHDDSTAATSKNNTIVDAAIFDQNASTTTARENGEADTTSTGAIEETSSTTLDKKSCPVTTKSLPNIPTMPTLSAQDRESVVELNVVDKSRDWWNEKRKDISDLLLRVVSSEYNDAREKARHVTRLRQFFMDLDNQERRFASFALGMTQKKDQWFDEEIASIASAGSKGLSANEGATISQKEDSRATSGESTMATAEGGAISSSAVAMGSGTAAAEATAAEGSSEATSLASSTTSLNAAGGASLSSKMLPSVEAPERIFRLPNPGQRAKQEAADEEAENSAAELDRLDDDEDAEDAAARKQRRAKEAEQRAQEKMARFRLTEAASEAVYRERIHTIPTLNSLMQRNDTILYTDEVVRRTGVDPGIFSADDTSTEITAVTKDWFFREQQKNRQALVVDGKQVFRRHRAVKVQAAREVAVKEDIEMGVVSSALTRLTQAAWSTADVEAQEKKLQSEQAHLQRKHHQQFNHVPLEAKQKKRLRVKFHPQGLWDLGHQGYVPRVAQPSLHFRQYSVVRELVVFFRVDTPSVLEISATKQGVEMWRKTLHQRRSGEVDSVACPIGTNVFYRDNEDGTVARGRVLRHFPRLSLLHIEPEASTVRTAYDHFSLASEGEKTQRHSRRSEAEQWGNSERGMQPRKVIPVYVKQERVRNERGVRCNRNQVLHSHHAQENAAAKKAAARRRARDPSRTSTSSDKKKMSEAARRALVRRRMRRKRHTGFRFVRIDEGAMETVDALHFHWRRAPENSKVHSTPSSQQIMEEPSSSSSGSQDSTTSRAGPAWGVHSFTLGYVQDARELWDAAAYKELWYNEMMRRAEGAIWGEKFFMVNAGILKSFSGSERNTFRTALREPSFEDESKYTNMWPDFGQSLGDAVTDELEGVRWGIWFAYGAFLRANRHYCERVSSAWLHMRCGGNSGSLAFSAYNADDFLGRTQLWIPPKWLQEQEEKKSAGSMLEHIFGPSDDKPKKREERVYAYQDRELAEKLYADLMPAGFRQKERQLGRKGEAAAERSLVVQPDKAVGLGGKFGYMIPGGFYYHFPLSSTAAAVRLKHGKQSDTGSVLPALEELDMAPRRLPYNSPFALQGEPFLSIEVEDIPKFPLHESARSHLFLTYPKTLDFLVSRTMEPRPLDLDPRSSVVQVVRAGNTHVNDLSGVALAYNSNELLADSSMELRKITDREREQLSRFRKSSQKSKSSSSKKSMDDDDEEQKQEAARAAASARKMQHLRNYMVGAVDSPRLRGKMAYSMYAARFQNEPTVWEKEEAAKARVGTTSTSCAATGEEPTPSRNSDMGPLPDGEQVGDRNLAIESEVRFQNLEALVRDELDKNTDRTAAKGWEIVPSAEITSERLQQILEDLIQHPAYFESGFALGANNNYEPLAEDATSSTSSTSSAHSRKFGLREGSSAESDSESQQRGSPEKSLSEGEEFSVLAHQRRRTAGAGKAHADAVATVTNSAQSWAVGRTKSNMNAVARFLEQAGYLLGFLGELFLRKGKGLVDDYENFEAMFRTMVERRSVAFSSVMDAFRDYKNFGTFSKEYLDTAQKVWKNERRQVQYRFARTRQGSGGQHQGNSVLGKAFQETAATTANAGLNNISAERTRTSPDQADTTRLESSVRLLSDHGEQIVDSESADASRTREEDVPAIKIFGDNEAEALGAMTSTELQRACSAQVRHDDGSLGGLSADVMNNTVLVTACAARGIDVLRNSSADSSERGSVNSVGANLRLEERPTVQSLDRPAVSLENSFLDIGAAGRHVPSTDDIRRSVHPHDDRKVSGEGSASECSTSFSPTDFVERAKCAASIREAAPPGTATKTFDAARAEDPASSVPTPLSSSGAPTSASAQTTSCEASTCDVDGNSCERQVGPEESAALEVVDQKYRDATRWILDAFRSEGRDETNPLLWLEEGVILEGTYLCVQGFTDTKVRFESILPVPPANPNLPVRELKAVVQIEFVARNGGTHGRYWMIGRVHLDTGLVHFDPYEWITKPAGYSMVGMVGVLSRKRLLGRTYANRINGVITAAYCDSVHLASEDTPLELVSQWTKHEPDPRERNGLNDVQRVARAMLLELTRLRHRWGDLLRARYEERQAERKRRLSSKTRAFTVSGKDLMSLGAMMGKLLMSEDFN
ncbi:unnamed protein product [Amoebophrya sp. A25]|nr:unnamed protein product [Amoebophrya sp. A25]|eukprot:GSA25T00011400001.1